MQLDRVGSTHTRRGESLQHSSGGAQKEARSPPGLRRGQFGGREPAPGDSAVCCRVCACLTSQQFHKTSPEEFLCSSPGWGASKPLISCLLVSPESLVIPIARQLLLEK